MAREKRAEWRRQQLREKEEAEVAEATFQPQTSRASSVASGVGFGREDVEPLSERELIERFERQAAEKSERHAQLADAIRREEAKELTFKPAKGNATSQVYAMGTPP